MKKITLLIALAIFSFCWQSSAQVQIGNGNYEGSSLPIDPYFGYTYSQSIYTAAQINANGTITDISYQFNGNSTITNSKEWTVYIGHTTKSEFTSNTDWIDISNLTQVYSGTITVVGAGTAEWINIDITDFAYNGVDNLVVAVTESASSYNSNSDNFLTTSVGAAQSIYEKNDSNAHDPMSPPTADGTPAYIPNIILNGITQSCPDPSNMIANTMTTTSADLSWSAGNTETTWNLEWKAGADFNPGTGEEDGSDVVTGSAEYVGELIALNQNTEYYVYYQADCGGGDTSGWVSYTFTTLAETPNCAEAPITPLNAAVDVQGETVSLSWTAPSSGQTPTGYNIYTYDDASGTNPVLETSVVTTTASIDFSYSQVVYWSAVPVNASAEASGCAIWSFTVEDAPLGYDCSNPIVVSSVPYSTSDDTANYGDAYDPSDVPALTGAQYTNGTGSSSYLGSNETVYSFTPASDGVYNFDLTLPTSDWHSLWLFEGCPFSSVVAYHTSTSGSTRSLPLISLTSGTTYYVVVSAWSGSPQTTTYDLDIYEVTCPEPSDMTADNLTETSTDLSWSAGNAETTWNIEWKAGADFTPGMGESDGLDTVTSTPEYNGMLTGLDDNTTYYVYYQADCGGETSDWVAFTFTTPATPPSNNDCSNATTITVSDESCNNAVSGTTAGSTNSADYDCSTSYREVWYEFTPSADGLYNIERTLTSGTASTYLSIYSGSCGSLTRINSSCYSTSLQESLTAGNTYLISVATYYTSQVDFDLCVYMEPTCFVPENLGANFVAPNSADLSWEAPTEGTSPVGYNWEVVPSGNGLGNGTLGSGNTAGLTASVSGLTADMLYDLYVQADCGGGDTSAWEGPFTFNAGYCVPSGTSSGSYVNMFTTTAAAGMNIDNSASGFATNNYGDYFDNHTVSLGAEQTFDFNVEIVGGTVGAAIWIDWNNDFFFDELEAVYSTSSFGNGPFTGTITVPASTPEGDYRMRVMIDWNDSNPGDDDACSFGSGRGEVEDYKITVDNSLSTIGVETSQFTYFPNPVNDKLTLNAQSNIQNVAVYNMLGQEVINASPNTLDAEVDMANLNSGAYFVKVTIDNATKTIRVIKN
ncbi:GEVED domain-containing protein [Gaetbulibacter sp. PBL-D1]|uniref:GEVED domain-containing protein n=1 Tax=Gaetbulibacter sp. PBL-D1 TaxID=3422594 RepID=UPI003D2EC2C2